MKKRVDPVLLAKVAERLEALARGLGKSDAEMARRLKLKPQTWNNYSKGHRPLPIEVAIRLADEFGVTLDWLYRGNRLTMPVGLMSDIERATAPKSFSIN